MRDTIVIGVRIPRALYGWLLTIKEEKGISGYVRALIAADRQQRQEYQALAGHDAALAARRAKKEE